VSVVPRPDSSTTQPSGMSLSRRSYTSILPWATVVVAKSTRNGGRPSCGKAKLIGFVPRIRSHPNVGMAQMRVFVNAMPI